MRAPEPGEFEPFDHETLSVGGAAVQLTVTKASPSRACEIAVETAELRYWKDGGNPSPTEGILAGPGGWIYLYETEITRFRAVRTGASNPTLQVTYMRWPNNKRGGGLGR